MPGSMGTRPPFTCALDAASSWCFSWSSAALCCRLVAAAAARTSSCTCCSPNAACCNCCLRLDSSLSRSSSFASALCSSCCSLACIVCRTHNQPRANQFHSIPPSQRNRHANLHMGQAHRLAHDAVMLAVPPIFAPFGWHHVTPCNVPQSLVLWGQDPRQQPTPTCLTSAHSPELSQPPSECCGLPAALPAVLPASPSPDRHPSAPAAAAAKAGLPAALLSLR